MGPRSGLDGCGKSHPSPGFDPRTVQPVASRYSDHKKFVLYEQKCITSPQYVVPGDISKELAPAGKVCVKNPRTDLHVNSTNSLVGSQMDGRTCSAH